MEPAPQKLLIGQVVTFPEDPFVAGWDSARHDSRGAVLVDDGKISAVGTADELRGLHPGADIHDYGSDLILPGFVDAHVHYPQVGIIASWGKRLIDWLETYTFPEETRFSDPDFAAAQARTFFDLSLRHGTTSVASYCTIHRESVDAFFAEAETRGMAVVAGKTCMDRNAPDGLRDTVQSAYDDSRKLLEKWHGRGRAQYAVTPRFSPTSTREQLEALGTLWAEHPECLMQTHISEQVEEIDWVKDLFPEARDYLDTYERANLFGPRAMLGHAIHLTEREVGRVAETGASLVHCPTSNTFIGSGLFDLGGMKSKGISVGLASDTGGGSSFSMLRTMAAAYEISALKGRPAHAAELLWLATEGSARTMCMEDRIGRLRPGNDADLVIVDLASTPAIRQRHDRAQSIWEAVFPTIMMGDDRAIRDVRLKGEPVVLAS